jgi:hypothetical protein
MSGSTSLEWTDVDDADVERWHEEHVALRTLWWRLSRGWPLERALTEPALVGKNQNGRPRASAA